MTQSSKPKITRRQKQSTWIILFAITLMGGGTYWVVKRNYSSPATAYLAPEFSNKQIEFAAFSQNTGEKYQGGKLIPGEKLLFKVSSTFPAYVALVETDSRHKPGIIYTGTRVPPGKDRWIERGGEKFVYVPAGNGADRVCLLATESAESLDMLLQKVITGDMPDSLMNACITFSDRDI